ncbi:hypothetical protein chiPu_0017725 [Chiloscyllium punctatum]|uniref:Uncharacterized protein n=1 Tax=Chiloscyllium punctatum TaxID=137246 RepID=A0A401RIE5_CHIPU|nr:hypothetical protein [Chiloscyllium punctatum]
MEARPYHVPSDRANRNVVWAGPHAVSKPPRVGRRRSSGTVARLVPRPLHREDWPRFTAAGPAHTARP